MGGNGGTEQRVFGVDELAEHALGALERLGVRTAGQDELVDVARVRAVLAVGAYVLRGFETRLLETQNETHIKKRGGLSLQRDCG